MATPRRVALLALCRSLPGVSEEVKWTGDVVFSVGGKAFATFDKDGKDAQFSCRVRPSDYKAVTSVEGIRVARFGGARLNWIRVFEPKELLASEAAALVRASYDFVRTTLPDDVRRSIGGPPPRPHLPKRLARARPKVDVAAPRQPAAAAKPKAPKPLWKPVAPSAPKVPLAPKAASKAPPKAASKAPAPKAASKAPKPTEKAPAAKSRASK